LPGSLVIKSRGTEHSNQVREFVLTKNGAELLDVYVGPQGVVTGSARVSLEAGVRADTARREQDIEVRRAAMARRSAEVDVQIAALRAKLADEAAALDRQIAQESHQEALATTAHTALVDARGDGGTAQPDQEGHR
jgi:circadian clock protein KaiC